MPLDSNPFQLCSISVMQFQFINVKGNLCCIMEVYLLYEMWIDLSGNRAEDALLPAV